MTQVDDHRFRLASSTPASAEDEPASARSNMKISIDDVITALRTVYDPEIPVNIYDLGLIYRIEPKDHGIVEIDMTLTAPGCPVAGEMLNWVQTAVNAIEGIESTNVKLVFDPPWDKSRMSEDVQLELGLL
jgi:FeS assembly SUF system protein